LEANGRNVTIDCSPAVRDFLGSAGYNPQYGARPLARLIETEVLNKLAVMILRGNIKDGETARVVMDDNKRVRVLSNHEDTDGSSSEEDMDLDAEDLEDAVGGDDMDLALYD
jgi:ATP-dependent Clp protease ATP-binding subunit ClpB